ncbi:MAG: hypothetical protein ACR2RE_16945 [Geminicoccaceae bacterium]
MAIRHLEESKNLRAQGARIGRAGMSQRVQRLLLAYLEAGGGYKSAMILAGQMRALAVAAKCDDYWNEQVSKGWTREIYDLSHFDPVDSDEDKDFDRIKILARSLGWKPKLPKTTAATPSSDPT